MRYCKKCNRKLEEGERFCPGCGEPAAERKEQAEERRDIAMAVLAYLGILVLIPVFTGKDSEFVRYHSNQGLVLWICELIWWLIRRVVSTAVLMASWRWYVLPDALSIASLAFFGLAVMGIINAVNGRKKELPILGKIRLLT